VNGLSKTLGEAQIEPVVRRVRQNDMSDLSITLKTDAFYARTSF